MLRVNRQKGNIALITSLIISAVFILLFAGMFRLAVGGMERISDKENSQKAISLATTCAEYTLTQLREEPNYTGEESHPSENCTIGAVKMRADERHFVVGGDYSGYVKRVSVEVKIVEEGGERTLEILKWEPDDY